MIRYIAIMAAFFATIMIACLRPVETEAGINTSHGMNQHPLTLLNLLYEMGNAYDCYFTVESAWKDGEPYNKMEATIVEPSLMPSADKEGLQVTLDALKRQVPNFTFMRDQSDSRIIHVIDSRLLNQKKYGLAYTVEHLEFSGSVGNLLSHLRAQGIPVDPQSSGSLHELGRHDSRVAVQVKVENSQVRALLSHCAPVEGRSRILWIARTKLAKGAISVIQFRGAKKRP